VAEGDSPRPDR